MTAIIIKTAASIVLGVIAGCGAVYIFNKMPAAWLCDYGEKPLKSFPIHMSRGSRAFRGDGCIPPALHAFSSG